MAAAAIAATVALPLLVVLASWRQPAGEIWAHLWRTQLLELVANTLLLAAGVGVGTLVLGAGLAWLVVAFEFPGRRLFEWALILPLAMPAYVIGFAFLALFDFAGPVQSALRHLVGPDVRLPELRSVGVVTMIDGVLPVVCPRPRRVRRARRPDSRWRAVGALPGTRFAA